MQTILSLFPSGTIVAILAGIVAAIVTVLKVFSSGKSAGKNEQIAKGKDNYEKHLSDVRKAADAGNAVRGGRVQPDDKDPYRRD